MIKTLPVHTSSLRLKDYMIYVKSLLSPRNKQVIGTEETWSQLIGDRQIIPTSTGRHALWEYLNLAGLQEGDEVLIAAYNFYAIVRILIQKSLIPVFVDIDLETLCINPEDLEKKITEKSRLVLVTHMFGNPADMGRIASISKRNNLLLFEDCAHAVGTHHKDIPIGQIGDGALFSFGIYKIINIFGGGMLALKGPNGVNSSFNKQKKTATGIKSFLDNFIRFIISLLMIPELYTIILYPMLKFFRRFIPSLYQLIEPSGNDPSYNFEVEGRAPFKPYMLRMIREQLAELDEKISRRRKIANEIKIGLKGLKDVIVLNEDKHGVSNYSYFGIYVPDPEALSGDLENRRIKSNPHEYYDCSQLPQFLEYQSNCEHASYASTHLLRLPNYPNLHDSEVERIILAVRSYFEKS